MPIPTGFFASQKSRLEVSKYTPTIERQIELCNGVFRIDEPPAMTPEQYEKYTYPKRLNKKTGEQRMVDVERMTVTQLKQFWAAYKLKISIF